MEFIVIWIALGIICGEIANKKERNVALAFALGLLFGVFTLVYYWLSSGSPEYEIEKNKRRLGK